MLADNKIMVKEMKKTLKENPSTIKEYIFLNKYIRDDAS